MLYELNMTAQQASFVVLFKVNCVDPYYFFKKKKGESVDWFN